MQAPIILLPICSLFLASFIGNAYAECPRESTSVFVEGKTSIPIIVHTFSRAHIAKLSEGISLPGFSIQGLTEVNLETDMELSFALTNDGSGWCANVDRVNLTLGYSSPPTIYLAKELKTGTCEYETVLEHEQVHVSIANKNIWEGVPLIRRHLHKRSAEFKPSLMPTKTQAYEHTKEAFSLFVQDAFKTITDKAKIENAEIDTAESYRAMGRRCRSL